MKGLALALGSTLGLTSLVLSGLWVIGILRSPRVKNLQRQRRAHLDKIASLLSQQRVQEALAQLESYIANVDSACFRSYLYYLSLTSDAHEQTARFSLSEVAARMASCAETPLERDIVRLAVTPGDKVDEFLERATRKYPSATFWRMQQVHRYRGREPQRVQEACDAILGMEAASMQECAEALLHKAIAFMDTQQYDQSLVFVDRAVAVSPNFVEARLTRARVLLWMQRNQHAALQDVNHVLQKDPQNVTANYYLAYHHYCNLQNFGKAASLCQDVLKNEFSMDCMVLLINIYAVKLRNEVQVWSLFDEMKQKFSTDRAYQACAQRIEEIKLLPMLQFGQFNKIIDVTPDLAAKNPSEAASFLEMATFATHLKQGFDDSFVPLKMFLGTADAPLNLQQTEELQKEVLLPLNALNQVEHERLLSCLLYLDALASKRNTSDLPNVLRDFMNILSNTRFGEIRKVMVNGYVLYKVLVDPKWAFFLEKPDNISQVIQRSPRFEEVKNVIEHMEMQEQIQ